MDVWIFYSKSNSNIGFKSNLRLSLEIKYSHFFRFMAKAFLDQLMDQLLDRHSSFENIQLVLPGRRSIVYARSSFISKQKKASWLPGFYSFEDFVQELIDVQLSDQIDLIFELYKVHQSIEKEEAETFDDFLSWGKMLLQDFNEIDRYLVDGSELFEFLTEAKAIENWNPQGGELSQFQLKYLKFYRQLSFYYRKFKEKLLTEKKAYQGLMFRQLAEKLKVQNQEIEHLGKVYFIGFNALTKAEEIIMNYFVRHHEAEHFWDADAYYMEDPMQEAGLFLRKHYQKKNQAFNWIGDELLHGKKEISIIGISGNIGQAKVIGSKLSLMKESEVSRSAVVLADENLLIPTLESIPETISSLNVTMGYPLSSSQFYSWGLNYLLMYRDRNQESSNNKEEYFFSLSELKLILGNSINQYLGDKLNAQLREVLHSLEQQKQFRLSAVQLKPINQIFGIEVFSERKKSPVALLHNLKDILLKMDIISGKTLDPLNRSLFNAFVKVIKRLEELLNQVNFEIQIDGLIQLYRQLVGTENADFIGEPLTGLQIMGVLESRTLDFENLLISSLNEGILPSGKSHNSFIPLDIKNKFALPSYREKDAIFAYHFYRLLQRAKNITLIYNTQTDPLQGGEKSRFIAQLLYELPLKNPKVNLKDEIWSPTLISNQSEKENVQKSPRVIEAIKAHLSNGLSPSALTTFISCPLDYYYKYILGLSEEDEAETWIADHVLGTIIHDSLEQLYYPMINKLIGIEDLKQAEKIMPKVVEQHFQKELAVIPASGNYRLAYEVCKKMISGLIHYDKTTLQAGAEIHLLAVEEKLEAPLELAVLAEQDIQLKIKGKIDRIDRLNGQLRIIDYKTGAVSQNDLIFKEEQLYHGKRNKALQLMLYQFLYEQHFNPENIDSGIISLRNLSSGFMTFKSKEENSIYDTLKEVISVVLAELLDAEMPFSHKMTSEYCNFCRNDNL